MEQCRVLAGLSQLLGWIGDQLLHTFMNSGRALAFQFLSSHAVCNRVTLHTVVQVLEERIFGLQQAQRHSPHLLAWVISAIDLGLVAAEGIFPGAP
ncbi:hypothetical protein D3C72_2362350 [compost metagenome]